MKHYAQINKMNICTGILNNPSPEILKSSKTIPLTSYDISVLGKIYDFDNHEWIENDTYQLPVVSFEIPSEDILFEPTQLDRIEHLCTLILERLNEIGN